MNFNLNTNKRERGYVYNKMKNYDWVTIDMKQNGANFDHYINMIHSHKFTLCPEGNPNGHIQPGGACGSHRFWECLYTDSIPIVTHGLQINHFGELPFLSISKWDDVTKDFLELKFNQIYNSKYNYDKIKMSYWIRKIYNRKKI